jgi:hypothetical protein
LNYGSHGSTLRSKPGKTTWNTAVQNDQTRGSPGAGSTGPGQGGHLPDPASQLGLPGLGHQQIPPKKHSLQGAGSIRHLPSVQAQGAGDEFHMAFNQGHSSLLGGLERGRGSSHQQLGKVFGQRHYSTNAPGDFDGDDFQSGLYPGGAFGSRMNRDDQEPDSQNSQGVIRRRLRGEDGVPRGKRAHYREEDVEGSSSREEPGSSDEDARSDFAEYEGSVASLDLPDEKPKAGLKPSKLKEAFEKNPQFNLENLRKHKLVCEQADLREETHSKVTRFIIANPVSAAFLRREKGRLPYSVFKAAAPEVRFLKSEFKGRPPTAFFPYPTYVHQP